MRERKRQREREREREGGREGEREREREGDGIPVLFTLKIHVCTFLSTGGLIHGSPGTSSLTGPISGHSLLADRADFRS